MPMLDFGPVECIAKAYVPAVRWEPPIGLFSNPTSFERRVTPVLTSRTAMLSFNPCINCLSTSGGVSHLRLLLLFGRALAAHVSC